jgi:hypothetical protein
MWWALSCTAISGQGSKVVTIICDTGQLARTRFWNRDFILSWGLNGPEMKNRIPTAYKIFIQTST